MKLIGSSESKIIRDKNGENIPHLEIREVILLLSNIVNNDYQQDSRILYTFVPNKPFGSFIRNFNNKWYFSKNIYLRISRHWSMVYRSN